MGAWIEIYEDTSPHYSYQSHPTWVRGLKLDNADGTGLTLTVAPHMGAWIEIVMESYFKNKYKVAPHMGAWIEICLLLS